MTDQLGEEIRQMPKTKETAELLGISETTLKRMREDGRIKFYFYPGKTCRYPRSEIRRLLEEGF